MTEYAEIVAEASLHEPARVREWIGPDGVTHLDDSGQHPVTALTRWATDGWHLVMVSVYGNLRIYTLERTR